ncbi:MULTISPECIES: cytochrome b [Rhodopseudomonas]|uniref:Cytochrome B561 n=1 Tax=Rhodopseudomonas palustris TaxID=1076 RepID=A0A0D7ERE0_RHOPL|nr:MULTISPECIES: cytochrome b [Rhodopseudomonas]KIZ43348.1 cytochrome B561 [Rhodopseudomonas palustris]MDF3811271.1 cytochrome b [Rhodopseudomonas sp. BAL398]WOK18596.1 cytochrome b [Rhodopseudomonas sp. BAL398]
MIHDAQPTIEKYPASLRILHWVRAVLIIGLIAAGWAMTGASDTTASKFDFLYPWHKSFGVLVFLIVVAQLAIRATSQLPGSAPLPAHERILSHAVHIAIYALVLIVPLMGYAMSSSYAESSGVFFFGIHIPELLPKDHERFKLFQLLHKTLAYTLLGLVTLHIVGALKHRFFDQDPRTDVLPRMM